MLKKPKEELINYLHNTWKKDGINDAENRSWKYTLIDNWHWKWHKKYIPQLEEGLQNLEKNGVACLDEETRKCLAKYDEDENEVMLEKAKAYLEVMKYRTAIVVYSLPEYHFLDVCGLAGINPFSFKAKWMYNRLKSEDNYYGIEYQRRKQKRINC